MFIGDIVQQMRQAGWSYRVLALVIHALVLTPQDEVQVVGLPTDKSQRVDHTHPEMERYRNDFLASESGTLPVSQSTLKLNPFDFLVVEAVDETVVESPIVVVQSVVVVKAEIIFKN